ncbi:MAG TPA: polysaccharide deacetylase family protein [Burkholderiaceae bacterium]|nr:polysaccharide deacetylase family protein [Burkholderiaceae bacterium]
MAEPAAVDRPAGRWRWPPLLQASVAGHGGAALLAAWEPRAWPWILAAVVADHALISAAGLWPRSNWLGANLTRLPAASARRGEVALTIDDGPDPEVTPRVLELLRAAGVRATFFCIAARARAHPDVVREIVRQGHSVQNHSESHRHDFSLLGPAAMAREIAAAQSSLQELAGEAPRFFRAPAGLRNPFLDPVLHRMRLRLASWTRRGFDTRASDPRRVLARLTRGLAAGDILLLHDGHAARCADGGPVILAVLPPLIEACRAARLVPVTLPHAMDDGAADMP